MRVLRIGVVMFVLLVLSAALFSSCIPQWRKYSAYPYYDVKTIRITDNCDLVLGDKAPGSEVTSPYGMPVRWVNKSGNVVIIKFDSNAVIGRRSIRLNPGESFMTLLRSTMAEGESYAYKVICKGEKEEETDAELKGDGPPPPIKEDPPPGGGDD